MDNLTEHGRRKTAEWRKKRIKRMKITIVVIIIVLLLLPTLLCVILGIQVSRLQNQVEDLINLHRNDLIEISENYKDSSNMVAFAAERTDFVEENTKSDHGTKDLEEHSKDSGNSSQDQKGSGGSTNADLDSSIQEILTDNSKSEENYMAAGNTRVEDDKESGIAGENSDMDITIKIDENGIYAGKKVYLTFDDGPSKHTDEILDILKEYGVKATFFVIGGTDKESKRLYQRIVEEGHTLGIHSYSHIYNQIYNSVEDFDKDFTKLWNLLYDTTGYMPTIYRFPGGSSNLAKRDGMSEFIKYLNDKSILYYDWNVDNGDATGEVFTKEQLMDNVLDGVAMRKRSIVLMHDGQAKKTTVDSLPELLETLISQGAEILPLNEDVKPIQQIRADEVK